MTGGKMVAGEPARDFSVTDLSGNEISLGDYRGKRLLLSFYRYASCPFCNLRVAQLIEAYPRLHGKGLELLAFFQSPRESILEYVGKQETPFPIVPDPERVVYRLYGVEASWMGYVRAMGRISYYREAGDRGFHRGKVEGARALIPADFLIGPDLKVARAYYGKDIGDHLPIEEIETYIDS